MERVVVILAGGQSRRMGTDKATLRQEGRTLLEWTTLLAAEAGSQIVVIGRERPADWPTEMPLADAVFLPDEAPDQGPLGGLQTALRQGYATLLLLSCDLPRLTADALEWLWREAESRTLADGLVTQTGEQRQPLFAIYTATCLPLVEAQIASGRRSMHGLLDKGDFLFLNAPPAMEAALVNVNTPEDWARVQKQP